MAWKDDSQHSGIHTMWRMKGAMMHDDTRLCNHQQSSLFGNRIFKKSNHRMVLQYSIVHFFYPHSKQITYNKHQEINYSSNKICLPSLSPKQSTHCGPFQTMSPSIKVLMLNKPNMCKYSSSINIKLKAINNNLIFNSSLQPATWWRYIIW